MKKGSHQNKSKQLLESLGKRIVFTQRYFMQKLPTSGLLLHIGTVFIILAFFFACGGGGSSGSSGSNGNGDNANELITIDYPTAEESVAEYCDRITIGGEVHVIPLENWSTSDFICAVNWENKTTGDSGDVPGRLTDCDDITCNYTWETSVPLAMGDNFIVVDIIDPSGNYGNNSITIKKPDVPTSNISGRVVATNGDAIGYSEPYFEMHLKGENIESYAAVESDGSYSFNCIPDGSYTITLESTVDYNYEPKSHTVFVNNGDVSGVDFIVEAHFINGRVGSACKVNLILQSNNSDGPPVDIKVPWGGHPGSSFWEYHVAVPNGTYLVYVYGGACSCMCPERAYTVIVNNEDVYDIDFTAVKPVNSPPYYPCPLAYCLSW